VQEVSNANVNICSVYGIHPFQTVSNGKKKKKKKKKKKNGIKQLHTRYRKNPINVRVSRYGASSSWTYPEGSTVDTPPAPWIGDKTLVGSFSDNEDANYNGKYFRTLEGKLFLMYQKQMHEKPAIQPSFSTSEHETRLGYIYQG
jgi:uncharacterized protein (DUF2147 family)